LEYFLYTTGRKLGLLGLCGAGRRVSLDLSFH
jgi:hypothetical protein